MPTNKNRLPYNATVKAYPAITDLQALKEVLLEKDSYQVVSAGTKYRDIYTVPPGVITCIIAVGGYSNSVDPTRVASYIKRNGSYYYLDTAVYGAAYSVSMLTTPGIAAEGDSIGVMWSSCQVGNFIYSQLVGYNTAVY
jgi:hypothetical protein